ncbi:MAG TPA: hypothetical protein PKC30_04915 [Saprospiraceae bacterium]|nr:hypothetical protein [Saprospiraceae bacterium]
MQAILLKIEQIELKIRKLAQRNEMLRNENKELLEDNVKLKSELQQLKKIKESGSYKVETSDLFSDLDNNKVVNIKDVLGEYIEELDQCIKLL